MPRRTGRPGRRPAHLLGIVPPISRFTQAYWHKNLARYAFMLGQYNEAIQQADQAMTLLPAHDLSRIPILHLAIAAAFEKGDLPLALAYAHRFPPYADKTALEPLDLLPHFVFSGQRAIAGTPNAFFQRLIKEYPDRADILNNIVGAWPRPPGRRPIRRRSWSGPPALPHVPRAEPRDSGHAGRRQAHAGEFEAACRTMQQALELLPPEANAVQVQFQKRLAARRAMYGQRQPFREDAFTRMYLTFFGALTRLNEPVP
jgi:tetratricopeptide (TPR) repeat protein